jgi:predicted membrane-bound spermidine synthase
MLSRVAFALVTASLLLAEIALTRVFSGTIGYYFAFMSISVAMLGLGAGSLWVTLRGPLGIGTEERAGRLAFAVAITMAASVLVYLKWYPEMGLEGSQGQLAQVGIFAALFVPFLVSGVLVATVFEGAGSAFASLYAVDLIGAAIGCVVAVKLLDRLPAPKAMLVIAAVAGLASPLYFFAAKKRDWAAISAVALIAIFGLGARQLRSSDLFEASVIRNSKVLGIAHDEWNDFSRVVVKWGLFCTWGLSETYPAKHENQFDLMIEGVAGTQIQRFDGDLSKLDFLEYDISALPHYVKKTGSTLALGLGGGFDILMARHFGKEPVVGVEVNPLVGHVVNDVFAGWSGRPYYQPGITVHFENARTWVKRDKTQYDVVTVTWVDSGAATGAGAFALTENYLYTVEAFHDYLARTKDDGVLAFMRARRDPEYDAIKGIGIVVESMKQMGIAEPEKNIVVSSVASPYFLRRELTHVMVKKKPWTAEEIAALDAARTRLHFVDVYTPGRAPSDAEIGRLILGKDRAAVYASFPFDMEPNTDDRPFYFFLRARPNSPAGRDVKVLAQSMTTIFVLIGAFLVAPLVALWKRGIKRPGGGGIAAPSAYFALLGLGFMLIEMKLLQQSVLVVGNPTLSLAAVLSSLLLSTGVGALISQRLQTRAAGMKLFGVLFAVLLLALFTAEKVADILVGYEIAVRTAGVVLAIAPLGFLLGCPLPLGMATLREGRKEAPPGLVAWAWGMNGMFGVAGSAVAIWVAIHYGLRVAFLVGLLCYVGAAAIYAFALAHKAVQTREESVRPLAEAA